MQPLDLKTSETQPMTREPLPFGLDIGGGMGAWDWDVLTDRIYADSRFARLFSVDAERAPSGVPLAEFISVIHPDDRPYVNEAIQRVVRTGGDYTQEFRILDEQGAVRWFFARGRCHLNESGVADRFPGVVFDITDRKQAEATISEKARLAALGSDIGEALAQITALPEALQRCAEVIVRHLNAAFARIWILNSDTNVLDLKASAGMYTHLDGPHSHVRVGSFKIGLIAQERQPHLTNDVANDPRISDPDWARSEGMVAFAGYPLTVEDRVVGVLALFASQPLAPDTMQALASVSTSIAIGIDRKRTETALRNSEERYRFLAESMPQMVWTATSDGALNYVNGQACTYFGTSSDALLGAGWLSGVHPEDRDDVIKRWQHSLSTAEPYETEFRLRRGLDGAWRWFLARAYSMPSSGADPQGGMVAWVGTCTDIDEQKLGQQALAKANRELEEFAFVASHDLQEPLRMVNIFTQMILKRIDNDDAALGQYAGFVSQGVQRMEALIRDLLNFSRNIHGDQDSVVGTADLAVSLSEALSVLEVRIKDAGAVITAEPLPLTQGDTMQLAHVFQNLISNSLKYRGQIPLEIKISARPDDNRWLISIQDNGIGFDSKYSERIFGLFKRLHKNEYPGTGLGLAICQRIVERYGGRIWAEGKPGQGATFYFLLPQAADHFLPLAQERNHIIHLDDAN